jgi:tRNA (guanine-N7-)-methyltransferase
MARLRKSGRILDDPECRAELVRAAEGLGCDALFFSLEPERLFSRPAALEVEIGSGKGDFILERARQMPERNFLAIELGGSVYQWLAVRCMRSGLTNLRVIRADARTVLNLMLPSGSVSAFHIYFPDPWPKSRHSKHRLFTATLAAGLARCLEPEGRLYLATDVDWYFEHIVAILAEAGFRMTEEPPMGAVRTGFGRRFAAAGRRIYPGSFRLAEQPARQDYGGAHAGS